MPALRLWYNVALPRGDIHEGRLDDSVFAANIWASGPCGRTTPRRPISP